LHYFELVRQSSFEKCDSIFMVQLLAAVILAAGWWWLLCRVLMALQNRGVKIEEVHHHWSVNLEGIPCRQIELQLDILPAIIIEGQKRQFGFVVRIQKIYLYSLRIVPCSYLKAGVSRLLKQTGSRNGGIILPSRPVKSTGLSRVKQTWEGDIEEKMRHFYMTLSEKDRRRSGC
jgi:hypothetical protein